MSDNKKIEKGSFIVIIILLVILVPLTCISLYFHLMDVPKNVENNSREFHFNNHLWFYDNDKNLISSYECETDTCNYANNTIDDSNYAIAYHKQDNYGYVNPSLTYAFLTDYNDNITKSFLYNIQTGMSFKSNAYTSVKDYGVGLANNLYIVTNANNKVGVVKLDSAVTPVIPFEYDFIGLIDNLDEEGKLISDYFVALKENSWYVVSANGAVLSEAIDDEIVTFTGNQIVIKKEDGYEKLIDYNGNDLLEEEYNKIAFFDKYLLITNTDNEFYIYDQNDNDAISNTYNVLENSKINVRKNDAKNLELYIDDELKETILVD